MQDITNLLSSPANRERLLLATVGFLQGLATWIVVRIDPHEPLEKSLYFGVLVWILSERFTLPICIVRNRASPNQWNSLGSRNTLRPVHLSCHCSTFPNESFYEGDGDALPPGVSASHACTLHPLALPFRSIQRSGEVAFPYQKLYRHSWNNFFLSRTWLPFYAGIYWALVWMCGGLVKALALMPFKNSFPNQVSLPLRQVLWEAWASHSPKNTLTSSY